TLEHRWSAPVPLTLADQWVSTRGQRAAGVTSTRTSWPSDTAPASVGSGTGTYSTDVASTSPATNVSCSRTASTTGSGAARVRVIQSHTDRRASWWRTL